MINRRNIRSPFVISVLFYAALLAIDLWRIHALTHGEQIYLLDDTYIHLSIAKSLLYHGVYGLSPVEPAMASSSILWPFLLAAVGKIFGLHLLLPLVLNILFALALLAMALHILRRSGITSWAWQTGTLMMIVLVFPLVTMTLDGMEHILYGFVFLLFLWLAGTTLGKEHPNTRLHDLSLVLTGVLLVCCRYEGVFAIFVVWLLLVRRRFLLSMTMGVAGAIPVLLFGLFSRSHGGMWVPNSLLMKTQGRNSPYQKLINIPRLVFKHEYIWLCGLMCLLLLVGWLAYQTWRDSAAKTRRSMLLVFLGTAILHVEFAGLVAGTPRYESYLIGAGVLLAALCLPGILQISKEKDTAFPLAGKILLTLALLPLVAYRGLYWETFAPNAAKGIYLQQYQAARFFSRYYHGQPLVANDVGIVSYYAEGSCLDLWGLATNEVALRKSANTMSTAVMRSMAAKRNIKVGFIYAQAFYGQETPPAEWVDVETWTIPLDPGFTVANATVHLYATSQQDAVTLRANLNDFRKTLPPGVTARTPEGQLLN